MPNASNVLIGQATISIDGTDIGYTKGGTTLRRAVTWVEVKADQHPGVVRMGRSEERLTIKTTLLEGTLENLRVALGYPSSSLTNGGNTLTLGDNNVCSVEEHEIVAELCKRTNHHTLRLKCLKYAYTHCINSEKLSPYRFQLANVYYLLNEPEKSIFYNDIDILT